MEIFNAKCKELLEFQISDKAADLLDHMLTYDAKARYNAEQCLNHPYLEDYKKEQKLNRFAELWRK